MSQYAIELKGLTRYFGKKPVVRDLDFLVPRGQVTALLGLNGAGKTTTLRMLMGLLHPTRGSAITLGQEAITMSVATRSRIGYLVEGHFLYSSMRIEQCEHLQRCGHERWNGSLLKDILEHFGVDRRARVGSLSRGQRAGVSLGLVLAPDPELLVLDDPALGLDPTNRRALNETLIEFAADGKRTVLLSSHLLDDVERIAERVAVMVGGRLKVDAGIDEFCRRVRLVIARGDSFDPAQMASVPGLIEARKLGDRVQLTLADSDAETDAALQRLAAREIESIETTFSDAVLAYLSRDRSDGSFFSKPLTTPTTSEVRGS